MKAMTETVYGKTFDRAALRKAAPDLLYACLYLLDILGSVKAPYRKKTLAGVAHAARRAVGKIPPRQEGECKTVPRRKPGKSP